VLVLAVDAALGVRNFLYLRRNPDATDESKVFE
jgi:hypothetical protein